MKSHRLSLALAPLVSLVVAVSCASSEAPAPALAASGDAGGGPTVDAAGPSTPDDAGGDATAPPGTDVTAAVKDFNRDLAGAICKRLTACCADADYALFFGRFSEKPYTLESAPPAASCATELAGQLAILHDRWVASVGRGRMTYDAARAKKCVADVDAAACGAPLNNLVYGAECLGARGNEVFAKIAPVGSACEDLGDGTYYGECNPAAGYCDETKKCAPWRKTGESCGIITQDAGPAKRLFCAPSLNCDGGSLKTPGKCSGPPVNRALGESCSASSGPTELCVAGTYCDFAGTGTCLAQKADGADCLYDDECATARLFTCGPQGAKKCGNTSTCGGK